MKINLNCRRKDRIKISSHQCSFFFIFSHWNLIDKTKKFDGGDQITWLYDISKCHKMVYAVSQASDSILINSNRLSEFIEWSVSSAIDYTVYKINFIVSHVKLSQILGLERSWTLNLHPIQVFEINVHNFECSISCLSRANGNLFFVWRQMDQRF